MNDSIEQACYDGCGVLLRWQPYLDAWDKQTASVNYLWHTLNVQSRRALVPNRFGHVVDNRLERLGEALEVLLGFGASDSEIDFLDTFTE